MPALLAYLIALTVLIGGSYSGIYFVSEHAPFASAQDQKAKLANRKKFEREAAIRLSGGGNTEGETKASVVEGQAPFDGPSSSNAAFGRELSSTTPPPASRKILENPAPPSLPKAPFGDTNASVIAAEPYNAAPFSTTDALISNRAGSTTAEPSPSGEAAPPNVTLSTLDLDVAKPSAAANSLVKLAATERPSRPRKAPRPRKLVLMTLQTIRYADGRIGERLVALQPRRRLREQSQPSRLEWFDEVSFE